MTPEEKQAIEDSIAQGQSLTLPTLRQAILNQNITLEQLILHLLVPDKKTAIEILLRITYGNDLVEEYAETVGYNF